ncbi:hypothetical protein HOH51_03055 [bacterium]|jgi:hypothetical protein|nr:hypothetical protein [bacterium]
MLMGYIGDFFRDIKEYRRRGIVYLIITILVSVLIAFITWWGQQQTITDLRVRLLTNQTLLQSEISTFKEIATESVPEMQAAMLQILDRIDKKLQANELKFSYDIVDYSKFRSLCRASNLDLDPLETQFSMFSFQPFYNDYNLEPILVFSGMDMQKDSNNPELAALANCAEQNNLQVVNVNSNLSFWVPNCYLKAANDGEKNVCQLFLTEVL